MAKDMRDRFLRDVSVRCGPLRKLPGSQSLYDGAGGTVRLLIRYSRLHGRDRTFYGLREEDLRQLAGHASLLCFLWDGQLEPLLVPYGDYEEVFQESTPAADGQYKVQVYVKPEATEMYVARAGRFNVEAHLGWGELDAILRSTGHVTLPSLSHVQMQTLLGAIGAAKQYDIWIPPIDRSGLDWGMARPFVCRDSLPRTLRAASAIIGEVDVLWIAKGSSDVRALFEVEHSTPIYSGLLRFNDVHLAAPELRATFTIVANDARRGAFVRQLARPTFHMSGLSQMCTFLEYASVYGWHDRIKAS